MNCTFGIGFGELDIMMYGFQENDKRDIEPTLFIVVYMLELDRMYLKKIYAYQCVLLK